MDTNKDTNEMLAKVPNDVIIAMTRNAPIAKIPSIAQECGLLYIARRIPSFDPMQNLQGHSIENIGGDLLGDFSLRVGVTPRHGTTTWLDYGVGSDAFFGQNFADAYFLPEQNGCRFGDEKARVNPNILELTKYAHVFVQLRVYSVGDRGFDRLMGERFDKAIQSYRTAPLEYQVNRLRECVAMNPSNKAFPRSRLHIIPQYKAEYC